MTHNTCQPYKTGDAGGPGGLGTRQRPAEAWHEAVGGGGLRVIGCMGLYGGYIYIFIV